jgi:hypothetical protein
MNILGGAVKNFNLGESSLLNAHNQNQSALATSNYLNNSLASLLSGNS